MEHLEALERLARLKDAGVLSDSEFNAEKLRLLNDPGSASRYRPSREAVSNTEEQDVSQFRGSTLGWLFGSFFGWLTLLMCVVPLFALIAGNDAMIGVGIITLCLGLIIIVGQWISNIGERFDLTTQRLMLRTGIIFKRVDEIELFRVKDVRVDYSIINQLTGIGTITLRTSDATSHGRDFIMRDIPQARDIRETIRTLVDQARQRRRVRELDLDSSFV